MPHGPLSRSKVRGAKVRGALKGPWSLKISRFSCFFTTKGPWSSKVRGADLVPKNGKITYFFRKNAGFGDKVRGVSKVRGVGIRSVEFIRSVEMRKVRGASSESHCRKVQTELIKI